MKDFRQLEAIYNKYTPGFGVMSFVKFLNLIDRRKYEFKYAYNMAMKMSFISFKKNKKFCRTYKAEKAYINYLADQLDTDSQLLKKKYIIENASNKISNEILRACLITQGFAQKHDDEKIFIKRSCQDVNIIKKEIQEMMSKYLDINAKTIHLNFSIKYLYDFYQEIFGNSVTEASFRKIFAKVYPQFYDLKKEHNQRLINIANKIRCDHPELSKYKAFELFREQYKKSWIWFRDNVA